MRTTSRALLLAAGCASLAACRNDTTDDGAAGAAGELNAAPTEAPPTITITTKRITKHTTSCNVSVEHPVFTTQDSQLSEILAKAFPEPDAEAECSDVPAGQERQHNGTFTVNINAHGILSIAVGGARGTRPVGGLQLPTIELVTHTFDVRTRKELRPTDLLTRAGTATVLATCIETLVSRDVDDAQARLACERTLGGEQPDQQFTVTETGFHVSPSLEGTAQSAGIEGADVPWKSLGREGTTELLADLLASVR